MNGYGNFERIISELQLINDEIKKNWKSEAADLFCSSFDDSIKYIKKKTDSFRETPEGAENTHRNELSDFSF